PQLVAGPGGWGVAPAFAEGEAELPESRRGVRRGRRRKHGLHRVPPPSTPGIGAPRQCNLCASFGGASSNRRQNQAAGTGLALGGVRAPASGAVWIWHSGGAS